MESSEQNDKEKVRVTLDPVARIEDEPEPARHVPCVPETYECIVREEIELPATGDIDGGGACQQTPIKPALTRLQ
jgi:hypothetical protein